MEILRFSSPIFIIVIVAALSIHGPAMLASPNIPAERKTAAANGGPAKVTISDAWIRALPAGVPDAGYFKVHNAGSDKVTLTGAQSTACGSLMLHKTVRTAGRVEMEMMTTADILPGGDIEFTPGGYHLMCMNPTSAIKIGAKIPVILMLDGGAKITANFTIRDASGH